MADVSNPRIGYAEDILTQTVANSVWLQAADPTWAQRVVAGELTVKVPDLKTNVGVDFPGDADALETAPTITMGSISTVDISRSIVRGYGGINKLEMRQSGGGRDADMKINEDIAVEMALGVDGKIADHVSKLQYDTATWPPASGKNANAISIGTTGSNYVSTAYPFDSKGTINEIIFDVIAQVSDLFGLKKVGLPQARTLFGAPLGRLVCVTSLPIARKLVNVAADKSTLQRPGDFAADAIINRGIFGMNAYMGRISDIDIMADLSLALPTGKNPWPMYFFPSNSILQADYSVIALSDRDFEQGNTDHKFIRDRVAVGLFGVQAMRPEWFVRVQVNSSAS